MKLILSFDCKFFYRIILIIKSSRKPLKSKNQPYPERSSKASRVWLAEQNPTKQFDVPRVTGDPMRLDYPAEKAPFSSHARSFVLNRRRAKGEARADNERRKSPLKGLPEQRRGEKEPSSVSVSTLKLAEIACKSCSAWNHAFKKC